MIAERFEMTEMSDTFFYFPIELSGLDLQSPLIPLLLIRETACKNPMERIEKAFEREEELYFEARNAYNDGKVESNTNSRFAYIPGEDEPFMILDEYTRYLEETSFPLWEAYTDLFKEPEVRKVELTPEVDKALNDLPSKQVVKCGIQDFWYGLTPYYQWVTQSYASDVLKKFESLSLGEKRLLPIGLASILRSEKLGGKVRGARVDDGLH